MKVNGSDRIRNLDTNVYEKKVRINTNKYEKVSKMTLETESTKKCPVLQGYAGQGVASTKLSAKSKAKYLPHNYE